jgi:hypothetical protein
MSKRGESTQTEMALMLADSLVELGIEGVDTLAVLDAMASSGLVFHEGDLASHAFAEVLSSDGAV